MSASLLTHCASCAQLALVDPLTRECLPCCVANVMHGRVYDTLEDVLFHVTQRYGAKRVREYRESPAGQRLTYP